MRLELFIARKLHFNEHGKKKKSSPAVKIATLGVALGVAVMIVSIAIIIGFKGEVSNKAIGFLSHAQISGFNNQSRLNNPPIAFDTALIDSIKTDSRVAYVQPSVDASAVLKSDTDFYGAVLKGIDSTYNRGFFENAIIEGEFPQLNTPKPTNQILVSQNIANSMQLNVGSEMLCYFINSENFKVRKFKVSGIYSTNFSDYDDIYIVGDLRTAQQVNDWESDMYSRLEIMLKDASQAKEYSNDLLFNILANRDRYGTNYFVNSVYELNPQLFSWLDLLDMNVWIIIILMLLVGGFTIISGILTIILERSSTIGTLKAIGANNTLIRKVFIQLAGFLIIKGLIWGNIVGLLLCFIQYQFKVIKLDPVIYYISSVPIDINWGIILALNIGTLIVTTIMVILPTYIISNIKPSESIKIN